MDSCLLASTGAFAESDILSLSAGLRIKGKVLADDATGRHHIMESRAAELIILLSNGVQGDAWLRKANDLKIKGEELDEIISFLDTIAGLSIRRGKILDLKRYEYRLRVILYRLPTRGRSSRGSADFDGILQMVILASLPVVLASLFVSFLMYGTGLFNANKIIMLYVQFNVTVIASLSLHEYIHSFFANSQTHRVLIRRGLRIGILHKPLSPRNELLSSLLGPLGGALLCYGIALGVGLVVGSEALLVGYVCMAFHFSSWLPFYGDGKQLMKLVSNRSKAS